MAYEPRIYLIGNDQTKELPMEILPRKTHGAIDIQIRNAANKKVSTEQPGLMELLQKVLNESSWESGNENSPKPKVIVGSEIGDYSFKFFAEPEDYEKFASFVFDFLHSLAVILSDRYIIYYVSCRLGDLDDD